LVLLIACLALSHSVRRRGGGPAVLLITGEGKQMVALRRVYLARFRSAAVTDDALNLSPGLPL